MRFELWLIQILASTSNRILDVCLQLLKRREAQVWAEHVKLQKKLHRIGQSQFKCLKHNLTTSINDDEKLVTSISHINALTNSLQNAKDDMLQLALAVKPMKVVHEDY